MHGGFLGKNIYIGVVKVGFILGVLMVKVDFFEVTNEPL